MPNTQDSSYSKTSQLCCVLTTRAPNAFTYIVKGHFPPFGTLVRIDLRGRSLVGIVWDKQPQEGLVQTKIAEPLHPSITLAPSFIRYIKRAARYTMATEAQILRLVLPSQDVLQPPKRTPKSTTVLSDTALLHVPIDTYTLQTEQQQAKNSIDQQLSPPRFRVIVLQGVTGSGKTETFFSSIHLVLAAQKQALILLPEIMLAEQIFLRAQIFFPGKRVALWHSDLTKSQRSEIWQSWKDGHISVLIGTRSALHLPTKNLSLIVVDEEHDNGYKQERGGAIYHGRDLAILRAECENIPVILSSATPSIETLYNLNRHAHYQRVTLQQRFGTAKMPSITLVDTSDATLCPLKKNLSLPLQKALLENFEKKQQSLLFLNRRGFSPVVICVKCGTPLYCSADQHVLAYHLLSSTKDEEKKECISIPPHTKLLCHLCGKRESVPNCCPQCKQDTSFIPRGLGVERIAQEVSDLIPSAHIAVATSDTLDTRKKLANFLQEMNEGTIDIVVGTQLIAKGLHFPSLSLVGIISAVQNGQHIDFRFGEKSVQMIQQVTGRAGRNKNVEGHVIIQHQGNVPSPLTQFLGRINSEHALEEFIKEELILRKNLAQPPYTFYLALIVSAPNLTILEKYCQTLYKGSPTLDHLVVFPPIPAPIPFFHSRYRMRFLIKSFRPHLPQEPIAQWLAKYPLPHAIRLQIDVNPFSFF